VATGEAYELALVSAPPAPPVVHLRFYGHRLSIVLTLGELEGFSAHMGQLWAYVQHEGLHPPGPPPSAS
jgi:hypothetical protein